MQSVVAERKALKVSGQVHLVPAADLLSVSPTSHIAISDGICGGGATGLLCMKTRHGGIDAIAHIRFHLYWISDLR